MNKDNIQEGHTIMGMEYFGLEDSIIEVLRKEVKILSNHNATYQQRNTVSINRDKLVEIAINPNLTKKDLRVLVLLLTQLDGFTQPKVLRKDFFMLLKVF